MSTTTLRQSGAKNGASLEAEATPAAPELVEQEAPENGFGAASTHDVQQIRVGLCRPSPRNPRIFRENEAFRQLVASIGEIGVASPIMVRPMLWGYEIIFGERRWRACEALGLELIPAIVRDMSDHDALVLTITENMHREDITPLEEAGAVADLLQEGFTLEQAAAQLGRSVSFVARRSKLASLLDDWKALFGGKDPILDLSGWPASHMELVARLPAGTQKAAVQGIAGCHGAERYTLADLQRFLGNYIRLIKGAPWKLEAKIGGIQPCATCTMRSSCQPELFAEDEAIGGKVESGDVCLDGECWDRKKLAFLKDREAELREAHKSNVTLVATSYMYERDTKALGELGKNVKQEWNVEKVKKSDPGARPALIVHGSDAGKVIYIKDKNGGAGGTGKKPLAEKRKQLQERRTRRAVGLVRDLLLEDVKIAHKGVMTELDFPTVIRIASVYGIKGDSSLDEHYKTVDLWTRLEERGTHDAELTLTAKVFSRLEELIAHCENSDTYRAYKPEAVKVCELLGWDFQTYLDTATAEMPEPKAWAKEAEEEAKAAQANNDQVKSSKSRKRRVVAGHDGKAAAAGERPDDDDDDPAASQ